MRLAPFWFFASLPLGTLLAFYLGQWVSNSCYWRGSSIQSQPYDVSLNNKIETTVEQKVTWSITHDEYYDDDDDDDDDEYDDDDDSLIPNLEFNTPSSGQTIKFDIHSISNMPSEDTLVSTLRELLPWKLLSTHCHKPSTATTHCIGLFVESNSSKGTCKSNSRSHPAAGHFAFTFHESHSLFFTLFTTTGGSAFLLNLSETLKRFVMPLTGDFLQDLVNDSHIYFKFQYRGIPEMPEDTHITDPYSNDLGDELNARESMFRTVHSVKSDFQRIDFIDVLGLQSFKSTDPLSFEGYYQSLTNESSYEYQNAELFKPDRVVFLDGVMQSSSHEDEAYHEALVHPAMVLQEDPRRVGIIGGGEGATLREVLKHQSVESVVMIDIDEVMVKASDKYLPSWNDCTDIIGIHNDCFLDPRSTLLFEDALAWFMNNFPPNVPPKQSSFDLIIMDALDPQDIVEFANLIYNSDMFLQSLYNGLTANGILIMQVGESTKTDDPPEELSFQKNRSLLTDLLSKVGFQSLHMYTESHCGFGLPWTFLMACKTYCRNKWLEPLSVDIAIHKRIRRSHSGKPLLKYFDGSTMRQYERIHKSAESVYCRSHSGENICQMAQGYNSELDLIERDSFEITHHEKIQVHAKHDITEFSYIETGHPIHLFSNTVQTLIHDVPSITHFNPLLSFVQWFGSESALPNDHDIYIDTGLETLFTRNDTDANVMRLASWKEMTFKNGMNTYNPVVDRHLSSLAAGSFISVKNISQGETLIIQNR